MLIGILHRCANHPIAAEYMCGLSVDNELRPFVQFVALLKCMFCQVFRLDDLGHVELMQRYCPLTHIEE